MTNNCPFNVEPYAKAEIIKKPNVFNLNYTNQDFWSMKTRLIQFTQQRFAGEFSDFVESSLAVMLLENWAFVADTLSFKMDQIANEIFIDTVTELENAFRLCKLVGFQPTAPIAAKSYWTASLTNAITTDITIPTPIRIEVNGGGESLDMELFAADSEGNPLFDEDILLPANSLVNASIVGLEGLTRTEEIIGTGGANQTIRSGFRTVLFDSVKVEIDGVLWNKVDFFTESQQLREYRVEYNSDFSAFIIFGNGVAGMVPSMGSLIRITYRTGGGVRGNLVTNATQKSILVDVPGLSYTVPVFLNNYTRAQYGFDGDTIDDIRRKLPAYLRTQDRAVTGLDYKTLTDQFATPYQGQIGKSIAILRNHGCAANIIDIYILARKDTETLETASDQLKTALMNYIESKKMITDYICIKDGIPVVVDVNISVTIDKFYKKFEDELRVKILNRVNSFFSISRWEFGQSLKESDIVKELSDLKEISSIDIAFSTDESPTANNIVTAKYYEIIRPDIIDLGFVYE